MLILPLLYVFPNTHIYIPFLYVRPSAAVDAVTVTPLSIVKFLWYFTTSVLYVVDVSPNDTVGVDAS